MARAWGVLLSLAAAVPAGEVVLEVHRGGEPVAGLVVSAAGETARSDARGLVRFRDLPAGAHRVAARFPAAAPGRFGGEVALGTLEVKGALYGARLEVPRPQVVAGVVTDGSTGRPLPGATVSLRTSAGDAIEEQATPADGRFRFEGLAAGVVRLTASHEGFSEASRMVATGAGWPLELALLPPGRARAAVRRIVAVRGGRPARGVSAELALESGEVVTLADLERGYLRLPPLDGAWRGEGAVTRIELRDEDGWSAVVPEPAPGQQFQIVPLEGLVLSGRVVGPSGEGAGGVPVVVRSGDRSAVSVTGSDGTFELRGLDAGRCTVDVAGTRLRPVAAVPVELRGDTGPVTVRVAPAVTLSGRVTGLAANVVARVGCQDRSATTAADGSFRLEGLRPAPPFSVRVRAPGYAARFVRTAGDGPVEVALVPVVALSGVVQDPGGKPVAGAMVTAGPRFLARTDARGRYRIEGIPADGERRVQAQAPGYAPAFTEPLALGRSDVAVPPLVLQRGVEISGFVRDEAGRPVAGVAIAAHPRADLDGRWSLPRTSEPTGRDGRFFIPRVARGPVALRLAARPRGGDRELEPPLVPVRAVVVVDAPAAGVAFRVRRVALVDVARGEGIAWQAGLAATLARARRENRPVLVAINALDEERGNRTMAFRRYRDPDLVAATRPFLCLVASPSEHGQARACTRFGVIACAAHQEVLRWALRRYGEAGDLVSPQHVILAPDGRQLFRRPYWIEAAVLQRELEKALVRVAPRRALRLAARTRRAVEEELRAGTLDPAAYVGSGDPLAAAVLLDLYEEDEDDRWLAPLKTAGEEVFPLLRLFLVDGPELVPVARAIDPARGGWWERYHRGGAVAVPPPADPKLARAWRKLQQGDRSGLASLLAALSHPVDGAEVHACLVELAGVDLGRDPRAWKEHFAR